MKKVMLMVAFMVAAVAASAQVYIGGSLGVNTGKDKHVDADGVDSPTETNFNITPEIGYYFDDKWSVGLGIGYGFSSVEDESKTNSFNIDPYVRYNFVKWNSVSLFVQGGLGYSWSKITPDDDDDPEYTTDKFYIGFKPGVRVDLTDKLAFVATVGNLGWETGKENAKEDVDYKNGNKFDFNVNLSSINFAMYYNF